MPGRNFDYPKPLRGRMAKNYLSQMAENASRLDRSLTDDDKLPAWVDYYIATSADRLQSVGTYMQNEIKKFQPSSKSDLHGVDLAGPLDWLDQLDAPDEEGNKPFYTRANSVRAAWVLSAPLAGLLEYTRSRSIPMTVAASVMSLPYILVRGFVDVAKYVRDTK
jgi:hypothetical protein